MRKTISNISLDIQAGINSLTRRSRKARAFARHWNEPQIVTGHPAGDCVFFLALGFLSILTLAGCL